MVPGGTQNLVGWFQTRQKWTDLEQYVNLDIIFKIQLQKLEKLQVYELNKIDQVPRINVG